MKLSLAGLFRLLAALAVVSLLFFNPLISHAMAQAVATTSDTSVTIPYGNWISQGAGAIGSIAIAALSVGLSFLPAQIGGLIKMFRINQLLEKAVIAAINKTAGAEVGKALTVDVGNKVIAKALEYAVEHGPGALLNWAGGLEGLRDKIIARIQIVGSGAVS